MTTQPNLLLLLTDQQRHDSLGCFGFLPAHIPHLASEGVLRVHTHAFCVYRNSNLVHSDRRTTIFYYDPPGPRHPCARRTLQTHPLPRRPGRPLNPTPVEPILMSTTPQHPALCRRLLI